MKLSNWLYCADIFKNCYISRFLIFGHASCEHSAPWVNNCAVFVVWEKMVLDLRFRVR